MLNTRVSYPPAGVVKVAHVGQDLLEQGTVAQEEVLVVTQDINISPYTIEATTYKQMGYDRHHNFFLPYGVTQTPSAEAPQALLVEEKAGGSLHYHHQELKTLRREQQRSGCLYRKKSPQIAGLISSRFSSIKD
ncbi:hypothetical protein P4S72_21565 [Vibrio sp. PP-XX7]